MLIKINTPNSNPHHLTNVHYTLPPVTCKVIPLTKLSSGLASASIEPAASLTVPARRRATLANLFSGSSGLAPMGIPNGMVLVFPSGRFTVWTLSIVFGAVRRVRMVPNATQLHRTPNLGPHS